MKKFFEVNLPATLSYLVGNELIEKYENAVKSITHRTEVLNAALEQTNVEPNKFHLLAKALFDQNPEHFDSLTAESVASIVSLMDDGKPTVHREEWPNATVLFDTAFTTTKEWESLRHVGIGGSESSVIRGVNHYTDSRKLYHDKIGTPMLGKIEEPKAVFARGHMTENRVVEVFCNLTHAERVPESRMFASKEFPNSTANIDAIVRMANGQLYVFEAKTAYEEKRSDWTANKVPRNYLTQTRQYPAVLNDDRIQGTYISCMFTVDYEVGNEFIAATFDGNRNITRLIERDVAAERALLEDEKFWWDTHILGGVEPEPEDGKAEIELVEAMYPEADPSAAAYSFSNSDNALYDAIVNWLELNEERLKHSRAADQLEKDQEIHEAKIKECLAAQGTASGTMKLDENELFKFGIKLTKASTKLDKKVLEAAYPEAFAAFANYDLMATMYPDAYAACVTSKRSERFSVEKTTFAKEAEKARKAAKKKK